jgi:type I restriction enzyme S subunit
MSFVETTIGELEARGFFLAIRDGNHGEKHPKSSDYVPQGIPFIMASDIRSGRVDIDSANKLPQSITDNLRIGFCYGGDVLLSHKGSVGYVAIAPEHQPYLMLTPQVTYYRVNPDEISAQFLSYAFRDPMFQKRLLSTAGQQGTRGYVGITAQRQLKVRICLRSIQDRVVDAISPYDDLIENNRRRIALLEEVARMLYREWFVRFRFPGHEHVKIIDGLPEGWERLPASAAFEINPATPRNEDADILCVPMAALSQTGMTVDDGPFELRAKSTNVRFRNGDTLFARITPCLENGKTGYVNFLKEDQVACGSTEYIVLRGKRVSSYFVYLTSRQDAFRQNAIKSMIGSSGRQRVQDSCFDRYIVPVPPPLLAALFDENVESIFSQISILLQQNRKLSEARDLLLPRMMNGEITV